MFPSFIGILDIQSWWEVPSIAYFCSLFRTAFNLLDFDIEELEEALLTDGTEECASSLLTELIVRLLKGCLGNNDISTFNYQMYLRRLFRRKCQETGRYNPFNTDIDFQFLPLRTKVEILYALCDFRLDADDVFDLFKNLEAESLRVEPLGWDDNGSAFWYFYGTRLYREDIIKRPKSKSKKKKSKEEKKHGWLYGDDWLDDEDTERVWQVVCFTEADWAHLTNKFSKGTSKVEKKLYRSLSQNFLPEIPRLFQEKERLQRKRLLELPRRTSSRVLQKIKQKEEENKQSESEQKNPEEERRGKGKVDRENRAKRRSLLKSKRSSSSESDHSSCSKEIPLKKQKCNVEKASKNSSTPAKGEPPPDPPVRMGRKTNNSLSSATGEILISDDEPVNSTRKKLKTSQIFSQSEEDIKTDMYKVLEQLTAHEDAWPFLDPVEEEYAPNYYAVIRRPMDLRKMEERLDNAYYIDYSMFKADFKLIVNNCRLYNGQDSEYTVMVENLQNAFDRLTEKYIHRLSSSDEEIAVEYPLPTPSRKHKIKSESPERVQRKKRKSHTETVKPKSNLSDSENEIEGINNSENKESHKSKGKKSKKKRKGRHRHGKHSKSRDKSSQHKFEDGEGCKSSKRAKKSKRLKENKKSKKKRHKENKEENVVKNLEHSNSLESPESSNRSRSASPLPSIHTPTPSPTEPEPLPDPDFYKDKYDKIKERKRTTVKDAWESLINYKQRSVDKQKQNLLVPEKDKNRKLTETIEKLKAKNEKYKESTIFNSLFTSSNQNSVTNVDNNAAESSARGNEETDSSNEDLDDSDCQKDKQGLDLKKKRKKKNHTTKNEITSEALEQAVKDISKLLDDKPKNLTARTPPDSPTPTIFSTEEQDNSRQDDELYEKALLSRKEMSRKRPSSREPRILKRRELQRTIDRLQPGKSKGNLLTNVTTTQKVEEQPPIGTLNKVRDVAKAGESSPKLSLGSVLPTVDFTLGNDLNFNKNEENIENQNVTTKNNEVTKNDLVEENNSEDVSERVISEPQVVEEKGDDQQSTKTGQEKATPNLSAWFKAFGAPKSSGPGKKKVDDNEQEDKPGETNSADNKPLSPKTTTKYDSPGDEISTNPEGGDSPLLIQRHRRTSTGSSVSERSSFSQDLDSPRHQIAHTSPLLRSPASPRTDEFQKITYPIINGTIRAGFYQDTTSLKSSPEKSCSPRDAPQSPYSPYSQHVYASNSMGTVNSTMQSPNYFMDHNKSSMPTYSQPQTSPYFETAKPLIVNKPENLQQNQYSNRYSPNHTAYSQEQPSTFVPNQQLTTTNATSTSAVPAKVMSESKPQMFPVKKRAYNDLEAMSATKSIGNTVIKDDLSLTSNKGEYQKIVQSIHSLNSLPSSVAVTDLTNEKPEVNETNDSRDKDSVELIDRHLQNLERHTNMTYESNNSMTVKRKDVDDLFSKPLVMTKKDTAGIMHSGYNNIESGRRKREETSTQTHNTQTEYNSGNISRVNTGTLPKGYEIDAIAINLGLNHAQAQKVLNKNTVNTDFLDSEHTEKISSDVLNQSFSEFDNLPLSGSSSLNDINVDLNKKLYNAHSNTPATSDYENWKAASEDSSPADLSTSFSVENNKARSESVCTNTSISNYKNYEYSQYENYTMAHSNLSRSQDLPQNMISELRIPNPRSHLKSDTLTSLTNNNLDAKSIDANPKTQKSNKSPIEHPILGRYPYKGAFIPHGPLEPFLNIPGVFDRFTNDERLYSRFATPLNREKSFAMAQMLSKSGSPSTYQNSSCVSIFNHANHTLSGEKEFGYYKNPQISQGELMTTKEYNKKKKTSMTKHHQSTNNQSYQPSTSNVDVLPTAKSGMPPGSAFNFGAAQSAMALSSLYADNGGFSIEDFRNSTANQLMTSSYMTAAATSHQRSNKEINPEKFVKPAHQNRPHTSSSFPFMDHTQVRPSYSFVGTDPSSPLYQQYLQRHQEHLLRQTGAQIMSLYPTGYPSNLSVRQPYDSIRPSWL